MEDRTETAIRRTAVFTRAEILEKLGVDLDDFYLARLDNTDRTLTLHYMKDA